MTIRIKDSLALYNARQRKHNKEAGLSPNHKTLTMQALGLILYDGKYTDAKYKSVAVSMNRFTTGKVKSIRLDFVQTLCDTLDVDPNFLLGYPSKYDEEFNNL